MVTPHTVGSFMRAVIQLDGAQEVGGVPVNKDEIKMFAADLPELLIPLSPVKVLAGCKHIGNTNFTEDQHLGGHGLKKNLQESVFCGRKQGIEASVPRLGFTRW